MFARREAAQGLLRDGDIEAAARLLVSLGDGPDMPRNSPQAHGTPTERVGWFLRGYQTGSLTVCRSVYRVLYHKKG
jgi:predicted metalloprotease